jgi:hypothetical protein
MHTRTHLMFSGQNRWKINDYYKFSKSYAQRTCLEDWLTITMAYK